jgi:predicted enzyme related to lactoylglutathione lyase
MAIKRDRTIDYIEFTCPDIEAAKAFSETVFGWTFTDYGPDYTGFGDGRLAGASRQGEAATASRVLVVIFVDDLEGAVERVKKAGGAITQEIFSFPGGARFQFRDPAGDKLAARHEN